MNEKMLKIVTIGGGSSYTPELIEGYIKRKDELPIKEIVLVDVEAGKEKLEIVGNLARRQIAAAGLPWKVTLTLNRFEALKDADYVTTQFRVGQLDARIRDERIPLSHGVLGQETNGAGGIMKAFRTIPVLLDIIEDMKQQCPDAWLINFTNPAGMMTETAIKHAGWQRTIGLCNVPVNHKKQDAQVLGEEEESLFYHFAGINHFHWHRVWDKKGQERTVEVIDKLYAPTDGQALPDMENIYQASFQYEQLRDLKMLPCGYHRYYYAEEEMLQDAIEGFDKGETRAQLVKETEQKLFKIYENQDLTHKPEELSMRGGTYYSEVACEIIASIHNDKHTEMVVSTQNNGTLDDLPYDSSVEVSGVVTAKGFVPYNWGRFDNPSARGLLQLMKGMEETVIKAGIEGDYNAALQAFITNPLIPGGATAKKLLDQMLYANKEYLPQFSERIMAIEAEQPETVYYIDQLMLTN